ncbi:MAG: DM13 domain-containing protein [Actinomycetota bacterium]
MKRPLVLVVGAMALVAGFLLFRPDKLFADDPVDEALAEAFTSTIVGSETTSAGTTASVTTNVQPIALTTGSFSGIDHRAAGTATVYEEGGRYVLRLEDNTDIQNGPDLYVWVLEGGDYQGGTPTSYLDLGKLKGNIGGQNYDLPEEFDLEVHRAVLIWCLRFAVPFALAPLA